MTNTNNKVHSNKYGEGNYHFCEYGCKRLVKCSQAEHLKFAEAIRCFDCADR